MKKKAVDVVCDILTERKDDIDVFILCDLVGRCTLHGYYERDFSSKTLKAAIDKMGLCSVSVDNLNRAYIGYDAYVLKENKHRY